jgi:23S rRNA (cytidine1920-2'-O)/16S rRNA (cytidine1409-2'-O)-methyltransferase
VIRDPAIRAAAIAKVRQAMDAHGFDVEGGCDSAVKGPKENVEHFLLARRK